MQWSPEAEAAIKKVPFFVRKRVRARVERETRAADFGAAQFLLMLGLVILLFYLQGSGFFCNRRRFCRVGSRPSAFLWAFGWSDLAHRVESEGLERHAGTHRWSGGKS